MICIIRYLSHYCIYLQCILVLCFYLEPVKQTILDCVLFPVSLDREREELRPLANSLAPSKQSPLRANGIKNNLLRPDQFLNQRANGGTGKLTLCVCLSVCQSVSLSLSVSLCVCLSVCVSVCPSIRLSIRPSARPPVPLSLSLSLSTVFHLLLVCVPACLCLSFPLHPLSVFLLHTMQLHLLRKMQKHAQAMRVSSWVHSTMVPYTVNISCCSATLRVTSHNKHSVVVWVSNAFAPDVAYTDKQGFELLHSVFYLYW